MKWPWGKLPNRLVTKTATHWELPIPTLFSILVRTSWSLLTEMRLSLQPMWSLQKCMLNVTPTGTSPYYLIPLSIFDAQLLLFFTQTKRLWKRGEHITNVQPQVGNSAASGRMDQRPGWIFWILRNHIQLRLPSMPLLRELTVSLNLTGGCRTWLRKERI